MFQTAGHFVKTKQFDHLKDTGADLIAGKHPAKRHGDVLELGVVLFAPLAGKSQHRFGRRRAGSHELAAESLQHGAVLFRQVAGVIACSNRSKRDKIIGELGQFLNRLAASGHDGKDFGQIIHAQLRAVDAHALPERTDERELLSHGHLSDVPLIDIVEPEFDYTAGDYARDAKKAIEDILSRGKLPIIAGGTGLYFRVLLEHYDLPQVETNYDLRAELEEKSKEELIEDLKKLDFEAYNNLTKDNSKRRIIRIIELIKTLDKPLCEIEKQKEPEYDVEWIMPELESREWLYDRINKRVDLMVEQGVVEETKSLLAKHGRIQNFTETIGYKEILAYLDGVWSLEEATEKLKQHTRNYAKRQLTWFRKNPNLGVNI